MYRLMFLCFSLVLVAGCQTTTREWVDKGTVPANATFGTLKNLVSKPQDWTIKIEERGSGVEFSEEWSLPNDQGFVLVHGFRSGYYFREQALKESMERHAAYGEKKGYSTTYGPQVDNGFWYYAKKGACIRFMKAIEVQEGGSIGRGPTHYWKGNICGRALTNDVETFILRLKN